MVVTIQMVLFIKWNEITSFSRGSQVVTTPGSHHYQTVKTTFGRVVDDADTSGLQVAARRRFF